MTHHAMCCRMAKSRDEHAHPGKRGSMVVDRIENSSIYAPLGARIARGLGFLERLVDTELSDESVEIDGDAVFARVQRYTSVAGEGRFYEAHRRYIDIQYIASGSETIRVTNLDGLDEQTLDAAERDVAFYRQAAGTDLILKPGDFAILYPHEAHLPMMPVDEPAEVRKVVVKVLV